MGKLFGTDWRLKPSILTAFILLTVPVFCAIIAVTYVSNDRLARDTAEDVIARFRADAIDSIRDEFAAIRSLARSAAAIGGQNPGFYADADSHPYLHSLVLHNPRIVSAYVGLADGTMTQTRRVDPGVEIQGALPPAGALFADRSIVQQPDGGAVDRYQFHGIDRKPLGQSAAPTAYDPRKRFWYEDAADASGPMISDPDVFATLGLIGFTVAAPFHKDGALAGVAAIDLTLDGLSADLAERKVSPGTLSFVLDRQGMVIASSSGAEAHAEADGRLTLRHVASLADPLPAIAYGQRPREGGETYVFRHEGAAYMASLSPLALDAGKQWQIFTVTPLADFTAPFQINNLRLAIFGLAAMIIQIIAVSILTGRMARPLERLAVKVGRIQDLGHEKLESIRSSIREISMLSSAVDTLDAAISSFSAFVPVDLVNQMVKSEQKMELGGHQRFLTVFFSDLEGFSTLSEELPTRDLMLRVSDYFELTTRTVNDEHGTIDKFIGDGVMAFWGAPALLDDHAWHACVAAFRIQKGMDAFNERWTSQDLKPLNIRIGLHSDGVLVGNIGSKLRMSYTVMGDGVNIAARLEGVNKEYRTRICLSHAVFKEAGDRLCVRPIEDVTVKGRRSKIPIYELLGVYGTDDPSLEPDAATEALAKRTRDAYRARTAGDIDSARRIYEEILAENPDDHVASTVLGRLGGET